MNLVLWNAYLLFYTSLHPLSFLDLIIITIIIIINKIKTTHQHKFLTFDAWQVFILVLFFLFFLTKVCKNVHSVAILTIYSWPLNNSPPVSKEKTHFFSSSESEEEEDHRKKFKIKIKPLPADSSFAAPSVDELKASIGNIALSPSPLVSPANVIHAFHSLCHFLSLFFLLNWTSLT